MRKNRNRHGRGNDPHGSKTVRSGAEAGGGSRVRIYGIHAVEAALANPARPIYRLLVTAGALQRLAPALAARGVSAESADPRALEQLAGRDSVHQGAILETAPLPAADLDAIIEQGLARRAGPPLVIVVLDQVTDPHNVGAIMRSCAAFGVDCLVMTERNSPPLAGALAKAASGGLEHVPVALVPNLARVLQQIGQTEIMRIGLDGAGEVALEDVDLTGPVAIVLGAEEKGMRRLTREHCDQTARLSTSGAIRSLNVSNAAAIALHTIRTAQRRR